MIKTLLGLIVGFSLVFAQNYKPSCNETLGLQAVSFVEIYVSRNANASEAGYDQAHAYWANCKRADNLKRLEKYPQLKGRLEQMRNLYRQLRTLETDLALNYFGGGTLYTHILARSGPELETHLSDLIGLTTSTAGAATSAAIASANDLYETDIRQRIQAMAALANHPQLSQPQQWNLTVKRYEDAFKQLLSIAGNRKDVTRLLILRYIDSNLWLNEILQENP